MAEEIKNNNENEEQELSEIEIAELANKELRKKEEEISKLKKDLAKSKLYSEAPEEKEVALTREECIERIGGNNTSNYDYAEAVLRLCDIAKDEGKPNPLGTDGEKVYSFFKDVIEECDGDKSRFTSIYQSHLAPDDPKVALAYNKRNKIK